ncbi:hypothetical protein [Microbacterium azadirachtae]|uniref:FtsX extracellular domain-containing protein n=1 Tax=Microbacterium azadirachtae TaxID=582680 RepID=A0A0F0LKW9_9MICO|nr:hypothetical protein [Microbacterium azadirachtae]KJL33862.1 hypothetical protein RS86_01298 [Microbacterium azadirachtae]
MPPRRLPTFATALALLALAWILSACSPSSAPTVAEEKIEGGDAWVVVMFEDRESEFDSNLMDQLLETELAADDALAEAGAGGIDGNEVGAHSYELYFVGDDAEAMWRALEPVFAAAPVAWTRVELRNGLEDAAPRVLLQG